jgi:hypothetical protein
MIIPLCHVFIVLNSSISFLLMGSLNEAGVKRRGVAV